MALKTRNTALAATLQVSRGTYNEPTTGDLVSGLSNLRLAIDGITVADDSYTGSVFQNADAIGGKRVTLTFNLKMKPPSSLPAANAHVPGRILQAAKCTEVRNATAIPAAAEAVAGTGQTTTNVRLGSSASTTNDIYRGFPLIISDNGSTYLEKLTSIRDYIGATKDAELMETLPLAAAADYQIPPFLGYFRDVSSSDPSVLSLKAWISGYLLELYDCGITGMRWVVPTSTKQQSQFPEFEFTVDCTIYATSDEATPSIPATGSPPLLKNGDVWFSKQRVGTSSINIDMGLQADYPPNANEPDGTDAPEISGGSATASIVMQQYLKATLDTLGLADAQAYHPFFAQWGTAAWNTVQITIPDGRLNYPNIDLSGGVVMQNVDLFIDVIDRNLGIVFPG